MDRGVILDRQGHETLVVMVKGSFAFSQGKSELAEEQIAINWEDQYAGDPASSGLILATDMLPTRPSTGITLTGHAIATRPNTRRMEVGIRVGALQQLAVVMGDRSGYGAIDSPAPFERIALNWENAFGGCDTSHEKEKHHEALPSNPVGKGFIAKNSQLSAGKVKLPNIENPSNLLRNAGERPTAVGFAPIAPVWEQRRQYAGTYDEAWQTQRAPLLPDDFDDRFLQCAPPQLTSDGYLTGNEECAILGMTEEGRLNFALAATRAPTIGVRMGPTGKVSNPMLEAIHFNTDLQTYTVLWKSMINVHGKLEQIDNIEARIL